MALQEAPVFSSTSPASWNCFSHLAPWLKDGRLTLWRLPEAFDLAHWPRLLVNQGHADARSYATTSPLGGGGLTRPLLPRHGKGTVCQMSNSTSFDKAGKSLIRRRFLSQRAR